MSIYKKNIFFLLISCIPFASTISNLNNLVAINQVKPENKENSKLNSHSCPELNKISSIVKLNSTTGLMLTGNRLEFVELLSTGYKIFDEPKILYLDDSYDSGLNLYSSIVNLNRVLFHFQVCLFLLFLFFLLF